MAATHRIFSLPRVCKRICHFLDPANLPRVIRVNRTFNSCGLDVLYKRLDSPWPLMRLLPHNINDGIDPRNGFTLSWPFPEDDRLQFISLASRVRQLTWSERSTSWPLCPPSFALGSARLYHSRPGRDSALLPRLGILSADCATDAGLVAITFWLSPSLRHLRLCMGRGASAATILAVLRRVRRSCRGLVSLSLQWMCLGATADGPSIVRTLLARLLSQFEVLHRMNHCLGLQERMTTAALWRALPNFRGLTEVKLSIPDPDSHPRYWSGDLGVRPLLSCIYLEIVDISCPLPLLLGDNDIEQMCERWPRIASLILNPRPTRLDSYQGPMPSLDSLKAVSQKAPLLKQFGVLLDPDRVVSFLLPDEHSTHTYLTWETLLSLDLGSTQSFRAGRERAVARLISELFPRAELCLDDGCSSWVHIVAGILELVYYRRT